MPGVKVSEIKNHKRQEQVINHVESNSSILSLFKLLSTVTVCKQYVHIDRMKYC